MLKNKIYPFPQKQVFYEQIFEFAFKSIQEKDPDTGIQKLLSELGCLFSADHCFILENNSSDSMLESIYEWHAVGDTVDSEHLSAAQIYYSPIWSIHLQKNIIFFNDITRLHKVLPTDYKVLSSQNIKSLILCKFSLNENSSLILEVQNPVPTKVYSFTKILKLISSAFILLLKKRDEYLISHKNLISTMFFDIIRIYSSVHLIDLRTDTFRTVKKRSIFYNIANENINNSYSEAILPVLHKMVHPKYFNIMLAFTDPKTLAKRIHASTFISQDFIGNYSGWCRARFIRITNDKFSAPKQLIFTVEKINCEKDYNDRISYLQTTDFLTNLLTREYGVKSIENYLISGVSSVFCLFDLDKFKKINDTFGHVAGDIVLKEVADFMKKRFRKNDILIRLGGDEMIIFLSNIPLTIGLEKIEKFVQDLPSLQITEIGDMKIFASAGIVLIPKNVSANFEIIYHYADKLLYQAKQSSLHNTFSINYADIKINNNII